MKNIYACSDLHGNYTLWTYIKNYLKKEDTLIFLGDAIDRGPDGLKILYEIKDRPNTIYLCGNHEDMMKKVIDKIKNSIITEKTYYMYDSDFMLWMQNGGKITLNQIMKMNKEKLLSLSSYLSTLKTNYYFANSKNQQIVLSHAGGDPSTIQKPEFRKDNIWNRSHIDQPWPLNPKYANTILVHGHTPVQHLLHDWDICYPEIFTYCDGHKIDIDLGSYVSKAAALLDLNTLKAIYFKEENNKNE